MLWSRPRTYRVFESIEVKSLVSNGCCLKSQIFNAYCAECLDAVSLSKAYCKTHSYERHYLVCIRGFYRLLSMFLIVSLAVRVKKRGAILWIISAGTNNWSLVATFNAESICSKPVSSTSLRCFLHSLLNILFLKLNIDSKWKRSLRQISIIDNCTFWRTEPNKPQRLFMAD